MPSKPLPPMPVPPRTGPESTGAVHVPAHRAYASSSRSDAAADQRSVVLLEEALSEPDISRMPTTRPPSREIERFRKERTRLLYGLILLVIVAIGVAIYALRFAGRA